MYTLLQSMTVRQFVFRQIPAFGISLLIAEQLYKFRSFTLECIAFLATWFVLDVIVQTIASRLAAESA